LNDHMNEGQWDEFVEGFCLTLKDYSEPGAPIYLVMSAQEWPVIDRNLREAGFHWSSTIIWAKDRLVLSRKDYHTQYEPIWYGWNADAARLAVVEDRKQTDLWQIDRPSKSELHPTMKPIELVQKSLVNSSKPGNIVLDSFGGSGSTLIACEQTNRKCRMVELDPQYCDVIIARWEKFTGKTAELLPGT
jgi:DNA modification methylase